MQKYKLYNTLLGWIVGLIALIVYVLTAEPSVSLWDCGEFISASQKLQVVHPPGAPLFLLLGRFFSLFAPNPESVAFAVNMLSVISSALTVVFTFWITTYLGKKIMGINGEEMSQNQGLGILAAGTVAGLALTFTGSFWFSAVEAEVYAVSSFFTALVFWMMFRWEAVADEKGSNRWLILIAYMLGLAIGTHLLNLLVIPALALIYYFKKTQKTTPKGIIVSLLIGLGGLFFIMSGIIPGIPYLLGSIDKLFVNGFGMPFYSGAIFTILLIFSALAYGLYYTIKNKKYLLNLIMICLTFITIGYSSYTMVVVRSMANPAIDMNNPDDLFNLISYINREQYGKRAFVKGPYFNSQPDNVEMGKEQFSMSPDGKNKYIKTGNKMSYTYPESQKTMFPRMGDANKEGGGHGYRNWAGMGDLQNQIGYLENQLRSKPSKELQQQLQQLKSQLPTFKDNITFFWRYQFQYMYMRYFMWNFAGRQNDKQGMLENRFMEGNWISGITPIDNARLGSQSNIPDAWLQNKARNKFYFIPLIIGLIGLWFHFKKHKKSAWIVMTLFLFTGVFLIVYMNQPPYEPRERDYASVGSFQTFCIWIGLGVLGLINIVGKYIKNKQAATIVASILALSAPFLMGSQGWDDNDRSGRYLAINYAKNYLNSCDQNAVLFTNGDNDTYPLWYAQNVEGYRNDVRIINLALLPTDWYSGALLRKVYNSEPLPLTFTKEKLANGQNEYVRFNPRGHDQSKFYDAGKMVAFMTSTNDRDKIMGQDRKMANYFPTRKFSIPVNKQAVKDANLVQKQDEDKIVDLIEFTVPRTNLHKGDMVLLDLLAENAKTGWKRPIYFTTTTGSSTYFGLQNYMQMEGLTYKFVPIKSAARGGYPSKIADDIMYNNMTKKFKWYGIKEKKNFFLDEKALLVPKNQRNMAVQLGNYYLGITRNADTLTKNLTAAIANGGLSKYGMNATEAQAKIDANNALSADKKGKIKTLLDDIIENVPERALPMSENTKINFINLYYGIGEDKKANKLMQELNTHSIQVIEHLLSIRENKFTSFTAQKLFGIRRSYTSLRDIARNNGNSKLLTEINTKLAEVDGPIKNMLAPYGG